MAAVAFFLKVTWPTITNDIRVTVYDSSDTLTPIASVQQSAPHLDQQFSFPGLPRINFIYKIQEYSIGGSTLISDLGQANFVPANDELEFKDSVQIQVGVDNIPGAVSSEGSDLATGYNSNIDAKTRAFTLTGTPNVGDTVNFNFSLNQLEVAGPYFTLSSQSNPSASIYKALFAAGNVSTHHKLNIYGIFDGTNFNVNTSTGFSDLDDLLDDAVTKLNAIGVTAIRHDELPLKGFEITGSTSVAGSTIIGVTGLTVNSFSISSTLTSGQTLDDLINDLITQAQAVNPAATSFTNLGNNGLQVVGYSTASGTVSIVKASGGGPVVWPSGVSSVVIPDFIGYEFQAFGRPGIYPFKRVPGYEVDASWDPVTGTLTLLTDGDVFQDQEYLFFEFATVVNESSGGTGGSTGSTTSGFSDILVVTANTNLTASDIGKKILIDPLTNYLEITMPDVAGVPANKITYFEMVGSGAKCAKIKAFSGQNFSWLETMTEVYICPNESFETYKRVVTDGVYQTRIQNAVGNFLTVGELFFTDLSVDKLFNAIWADGSNLDYQQYARLYNRRVVRNGDGITYATWDANNIFTRIKFSLKDTGSNNFRIPDLKTTPTYLRPTSGLDAPGDFLGDKIIEHQHALSSNISASRSETAWGYYSSQVDHIGKFTGENVYYPDLSSKPLQFNSALGIWEFIGSTENTVRSRISRLCIRY